MTTSLGTPNRIHLMAESGYLRGVMVAQDAYNFCALYEHTTSNPALALRFCSMQAARSFAQALNDHPGGAVWNAVDLGPAKTAGA